MSEYNPLSDLNEEQKKAACTTDGPLLIIAGPGSGKTKTLVARVLYLIIHKKVNPNNIMISTFTEKAAAELITRVSEGIIAAKLNKININEMYIGTLHSIFLRILKENSEYTRLKKSYRMLDEFEQQYFVFKKLNQYLKIDGMNELIGNDLMGKWNKSETIIKWINKIKEELLDLNDLEKDKDIRISAVGKCCKLYDELLEGDNAVDFASIQTETYKLLEKNKNILNKIHTEIQYIMVDEYQDTNTVQELILRKMAGKNNNICVVGDDDQGLYRFRGATIRNILEFKDNFGKSACPQINLETNYRSHPGIIKFYSEWMNTQPKSWGDGKKKFRYDKKIEPPINAKFPNYSSVVKVNGHEDDDDWAAEVVSFINKLRKKDSFTDLNQLAFLFRSVRNEKVKDLAEELEKNDIPVYSPRSDMFFERKEIKLLIGAFIFLFPQYPAIREKSRKYELKIWEYFDHCFELFATELKKDKNLELKQWAAKLGKKHMNLTENTDYAFSGLFYRLMQFSLFRKYFDIDISGAATDTRPLYNLSLFSNLLTKFEYLEQIPNVLNPRRINGDVEDLFDGYLRYLIEGGINEYEDFDDTLPSGCVSFMTIHQAKGLEFPVVFVDSLSGTPRKQYSEVDELLQDKYYLKKPYEPLELTKYFDFWRLFYTAFSRAQNLLVLTCQEKSGQGKTPSKYFDEVYRKLKSWKDTANKLENLQLESIKQSNIKKEYSFTSHVILYENCPIQYKYYNELEFAPVRQGAIIFGTLVHQTIEDINKFALRGETDKIIETNIIECFDQNYTALSKSERSYLAEPTKKAALKQVLKYAERHEGKWDSIQEAEAEISLVKENYILKGKVDLIKGINGTLEIVDFKSDNKPDIERDTDILDRYRRQLEVYSYLIEEKTGQKVSRMHLYYTKEDKGNPYISFDKEAIALEKTIKEFDKTVENIQNKKFDIKERPKKHCGDCDMRFYCDSK
jgi:DNA helicase-2/ATP-dependent DNA helicase PcrA